MGILNKYNTLTIGLTLATVFGLQTGCTPKYELPYGAKFTMKGMPLRKGEAVLAHTLFKDQIDASLIRLHFEPRKRDWGVPIYAMVYNARDMAFFGWEQYSPDFSLEDNGRKYGMLVHEFAHSWEFHTNHAFTNGECSDVYNYELSEESNFIDFCDERQAAMMQDYALRFLRSKASPSYAHVLFHGKDTPESDALLQKVVEGMFPHLRAERLKVQEQRDFVEIISFSH